MSDFYQYTRSGYITVDPDDAPTADESFADCIREIWDNATGAARIAISHERYALGIRDKSAREYTATEQAVLDGIHAEIVAEAAQLREWEARRASEDAARQAYEDANWDAERNEWERDVDRDDDLPF